MLSSQTSTNFRRIVINDTLTILRGMLPQDKPYVRGNFSEDAKGNVYFEIDHEGIWLWAVQPYFSIEKNIDRRNPFTRSSQGVFFPPIRIEGAIGYDPINYPKNLTTSNHLSRACIVVKKKFDYYTPKDSPNYFDNGIMALCLYRPDDPHEANKEAIKCARFTGYPVMHERSVSHVYDDFNDAGMLPFLMKDAAGVYGISPSDMKAKKDGLAMLQTRYAAPKTPDQVDQLATYPFEEGLMDLDNFDIGNTTPFDVTMAEIYAEHGLKQVEYTNVSDESVKGMNELINTLIPKVT